MVITNVKLNPEPWELGTLLVVRRLIWCAKPGDLVLYMGLGNNNGILLFNSVTLRNWNDNGWTYFGTVAVAKEFLEPA